ncbi:MAG: Cysteine synthase, partial [Streblomastix strix]
MQEKKDSEKETQSLNNAVQRCKEKHIFIPTLEQLSHPELMPQKLKDKLKSVGMQDLNSLNLFRITWKNEPVESGGQFGSVNALELPSVLTGCRAKIFVLLGKYFPTGCHKVGASFGPLVDRL